MASYGAAKKQLAQTVAKFSKQEVGFEHPSRGAEHCRTCIHFAVEAPRTCEIVRGVIEAGDWCRKYKEE